SAAAVSAGGGRRARRGQGHDLLSVHNSPGARERNGCDPASRHAAFGKESVGAGEAFMAVMIKTVNLTKRYGTLVALSNLNLEINEGDCFGFIGPNGAGKTTTIKVLATLLQ